MWGLSTILLAPEYNEKERTRMEEEKDRCEIMGVRAQGDSSTLLVLRKNRINSQTAE